MMPFATLQTLFPLIEEWKRVGHTRKGKSILEGTYSYSFLYTLDNNDGGYGEATEEVTITVIANGDATVAYTYSIDISQW